MSLSGWVPVSIKPSLSGVYEVRLHNVHHRVFARWTGMYWCEWQVTIAKAGACEAPGPLNGYDWRGLAIDCDRTAPFNSKGIIPKAIVWR